MKTRRKLYDINVIQLNDETASGNVNGVEWSAQRKMKNGVYTNWKIPLFRADRSRLVAVSKAIQRLTEQRLMKAKENI